MTSQKNPQPGLTTTDLSFVTARVPKTGSFEKPGYRQAGKFQFTFDFRELPIDPRLVSSAFVEVHLGAVSDDDFAAGMKGRESTGARRSVLQAGPENLRMVGLVDEWNVAHDDYGSTTEITGRDFRGVLLDMHVDAKKDLLAKQFFDALDSGLPIDLLVTSILGFAGGLFSRAQVLVNPDDWPNGQVPSPGPAGSVARHRLGAKGNRRGGRLTPPGTGGSMSLWDAIIWCCYRVGAIPYFVGPVLHIRPTRSMFDQLRGPIDPKAKPTPFAQGKVRGFDEISQTKIAPPLTVRKLVYGRDVSRLQFNRKQGGQKRPRVIRAVSSEYNPDGSIIYGVYPPETDTEARGTIVAPSNAITAEDVVTIPAAGITDHLQLVAIAQAVYEEIGRGEMGGMVETKNLSSFGGDNSDPDLLSLNPGDAVELGIDARDLKSGSPLVSTLTDSERFSFEAAVEEIKKRIPDENLARAIVASTRGQVNELQRYFRVENVKYNWDASNGVKISFDYQNYVVSRADSEGKQPSPKQPGLAVPPSIGGLRTQKPTPTPSFPSNPAGQGKPIRTVVPDASATAPVSSTIAASLPRNRSGD